MTFRHGTMVSMTPVGDDPNTAMVGRTIPRPDVPVEPVLSLASFLRSPGDNVLSVLDAGRAIELTAGRFAIALALEAMGLGRRDKVLIPAYHCTSMLEPLALTSSAPVFYRIRPDLSVDLEDAAAKVDADTRAMMVVHYFGFPQDMEAIRRFCDDKGLYLLEDCAHSFFGTLNGRPLGSFGDYAIASPRKFFPIPDGGCLISNRYDISAISLRGQGTLAAMKVAFNIVEQSTLYGRLWGLSPLIGIALWIKNRIFGPSNRPPADGPGIDNPSNIIGTNYGTPGDLDLRHVKTRMSPASRLIYRRVSKSRIVARRRENYRTMLEGFSGVPGCHALIPDLPDNVVPHLFPLWVDDLPDVFPDLEDMAVPMQRFGQFLWPGVDREVCPVSVALSRHLVQFSCHQEVTPEELDSVIERARSIIARGAPGRPVESQDVVT